MLNWNTLKAFQAHVMFPVDIHFTLSQEAYIPQQRLTKLKNCVSIVQQVLMFLKC